MNRRLSKRINKKASEIAVEWLKSMLPESEAETVTANNIPRSNRCAYKNGVAYSIPYSFKGSKRIIKLLLRRGKALDSITTADIEERVRSTQRS
jgi:hypothetical protein